MKKPYWLVAWLLVIEMLVILLFMPGDATQKVILKEAQYVKTSLGQDTVTWIHDHAQSWYKTVMLDSGFYEAVRHHMLPTEEEKAKSLGMRTAWDPWFHWLDGRIEAFGKLVYQFFARLALAWIWLPYMAILFVPAIYDGFNTRRIKQTNFDYASPIIHRYSVRAATTLMVGTTIAFFAPIAIDPIVIPVVLMTVCTLIGLSVGNMQKRV